MVPVLIAVGAATALVLLVLVVALVRHIRGLAESVQQLNDQLMPLLAQVREDAERTREHLDRLQGRLRSVGGTARRGR